MPTMNASEHITRHIQELTDWRGKMLAQLRTVIGSASVKSRRGMEMEYARLVACRKRGGLWRLPGSRQSQLFQGRGVERSEGAVQRRP